METSVSSIDPPFLIVASRVRAQQDTIRLEGRSEVVKDLGELTDRHMKQRSVCEYPVEASEWQIKLEKILMQHLTIRFGAGDPDELARAIQTYYFVAECLEPTQIPTGSAA